jgi:holin-like protein
MIPFDSEFLRALNKDLKIAPAVPSTGSSSLDRLAKSGKEASGAAGWGSVSYFRVMLRFTPVGLRTLEGASGHSTKLYRKKNEGDARMLRPFLALLGCQVTGEVVRQVSGIPLSGPIIGLILLLAALMVRGGASDEFCRSGQAMLGYLSLFFVPPGVGIMQHLALLRAYWLPMLLALIVSTALAMVSGALVMKSVEQLRLRRRLSIIVNAAAD